MPGTEDLITIIDPSLTKSQISEVIAALQPLKDELKAFSGISLVTKNTNGAAELRQQTQLLSETVTKMKALETEVEALRTKHSQAQKVRTQEEIKDQVALNLERAKNIASVKDEINSNNAAAESINKKRIQLKQLQAQYDALSGSQRNQKIGEGLLNNIKSLDAELKNLEGSTGRHQRKVGDYIGAIGILEKSLNDVTAKMNQMKAAGDTNSAAMQKLQEEASLLTTLTSQQAKGFSSLAMEIRNGERALQSMNAAGLEDSEVFKQMQMSVYGMHRQLNEFNKGQKLLEMSAPNLAALTLAAKGLGGAYAIGAGASALFADGNEHVQKELNKLVAIMTVLQGLNEVHELLERKSAIAALFNAAAQKLKNFVMTGSTTGIKANSIATVENTAVTEVNTVVEGENAVAAEANAVAMTETAVASETAAVATRGASAAMIGLRTALLATGIGALLILLPLITQAISNWTGATKKQLEEQKLLNDAIKELNEQLVKTNENYVSILNEQKKVMENELKIAEIGAKTIKDQEGLSARKHAIAELDKKNAEQGLKDLELTRIGVERLDNQYGIVQDKINAAVEMKAQIARKGGDKDEIKSINQIIEGYKAEQDAIKPKLERGKQLIQQYDDADQTLSELNAQDQKFAGELYERKIKAITERINKGLERTIELNKTISDAEQFPEGNRKLAAKKELEAEKELINSNAKLELRNQALTEEERQNIKKNAADAILDAEINYNIKLLTIHGKALMDEASLEKQSEDEMLASRAAFYKAQEDLRLAALARQKAYLDDAANAEHSANDQLFLSGKIDAKTHAKNKSGIDYKASKALLTDASTNADKLLSANPNDPALQEQASRARMNLYDLEVAHKMEVDKNAADAKKHASDLEIQAAKEVGHAIESFVTGAYERQINAIQKQIDKNNELKEKETQSIASSTLSLQEKAAAQILLDAQVNASNEALHRRQRDLKVKEAQFDRAAAILEITEQAAIAAIAALKIPIYGEAEAIAIGVIAAAQIASILAKPIPTYAIGTDNHPGGPMIVGEKGPEMRIDPSGKISMTPGVPTLTYGKKGTKIIPADEVNQMMLSGIMRGQVHQMDNSDIKELNQTMKDMREIGQAQLSAMKKKQVIHNHIHWNPGFNDHINSAVRN